MKIKNQQPTMEYRRFGKTNVQISAITLGGMRFPALSEKLIDGVPSDMIESCRDSVETAFSCGINHIETARGYVLSEKCYGIVLNDILKVPRQDYFLMTKGNAPSVSEFRQNVKQQLKDLKTDYFDFYAWHGVNTFAQLKSLIDSGCLNEMKKMKEEGLFRYIGFSGHAPLEVIMKAIETDVFDFVNLHYYYFYQRNEPAVKLANSKDMGVFIISPNDKGGQLFNPSLKLEKLVHPLSPIQWNARFCLKENNKPSVHTLSFGMNEKKHFDEMLGVFENGLLPWGKKELEILTQMDEQEKCDPYSSFLGYDIKDTKSDINIPEVLRFRKLWKCYDLENFCFYRYNMFEEHGTWFPGFFATPDRVELIDDRVIPEGLPLKELLLETHQKFFKPKKN